MTGSEQTLVPIDEAARMYGVSRRTLFRLIAAGELAKFRRRGDRRSFVDAEQVRTAVAFRPKQ
jgi:excisionase family DNA binding protein